MGIPRYYLLAFFFAASIYSSAQDDKKTKWVDSVFLKLKAEEKIGQLFVVPFTTNASKEEIQLLVNQSKAGKIGGLIIHQSGPVGYAKLVNRLQSNSKIPLLVGAGIGPGLGQTFDSTMNFFEANVLNAISNDSLLYSLSEELSRQMNLLHIHFPINPNSSDSIRNLRAIDVSRITPKAKSKKRLSRNVSFSARW